MANKHHCEKTGKFLHGDVVRGFRIPATAPVEPTGAIALPAAATTSTPFVVPAPDSTKKR